ncbi:MAG: Wzz/FepE/Etk N-terminal domain-containing protein [Longimicrobiales bacterium]|nr:Wzz/FepE/Etk N-terminal domain-containing protein [Longimicrobiales bacterium]
MAQTDGSAGGAAAPRPQTAPDDEISLWEVLAVLLRRRRLIVRTVLVTAVLAVAVAFLRARTWTSEAAFRPQDSSGVSELASLASQFGVAVPGGSEGESPEFYAELITSREILSEVAALRYPGEGGEGRLADLLEVEADPPGRGEDPEALRTMRVVKWLGEEAVSVSTSRETGTVRLEVKTRWPEVSRAIAENLLAAVQRFNLETRRSQAAAERAFVEERLALARVELASAEESLQAFLQNNRVIGEFSQTKSEFDRLQREVLLRQQVYTTLVESYEQARIAEVRDTPVITILQRPFLPLEPDRRGAILSLALGVVLGAMAGVVLAFLVEMFQRPSPGGDPARRDFEEAWDATLRSLPLLRRPPSRHET